MTPVYFHKISVRVFERRKLIFYLFLGSICLLFGSSLLRHFFSIDNIFLRLTSALSGLTLFWCIALGSLWLSYRNGPVKVNYSNSAINFLQYIGQAFQWLYSVVFGLWFLGLIIMTILIPFSVLFS
jgi:hypothetical protein